MRLSIPRARAARSRSIVLALACAAGARAGAQAPARPTPETTYGVHVFNDQNATGISPAQAEFCARRYAGTQKQTRADADRYRAVNPDFLVLHYRLGQGLGYRVTSAPCNPNGPMNQIIDGTWVQEWPGDSAVQERWFWHLNGQRVLQCQWGWYLADTDDAAWRRWWSERILAELAHNDDDGLFADSFLVPSFMGGFQPAPPSVDPAWESAWSRKMERFMDFMRGRFEGRYRFVPNVGTWVTTRDTTDFAHADGVMIEGFGWDVWEQYGLEAFTTQSDRLLALTAQDKIVIGQCESIWSPEARMYSLANYLLIQGRHTFLNFEIGQDPEWWPEYDVPIGAPLADPPASTAGLWDPAKGVYTRPFSNGHVYLNAGHTTRAFALDAVYHRALPVGGGELPWEGVPPTSWRVDTVPVSSLTLAPGGAAVVLIDPTPHELVPDVVFAGQQATLRVRNATPGSSQHFFVARGAGSTARPELGVTLGLSPPRLGAVRTADAQGDASWTFTLPASTSDGWLSFQAAETGSTTQVVRVHVH
jgi:hypothetical protein